MDKNILHGDSLQMRSAVKAYLELSDMRGTPLRSYEW